MAVSTSKSTDKRPARAKYWTRRTLEKRKIKRMMKAYGLTESKAKERWYAERNGRRVKGDYMDYSGGKADTHKICDCGSGRKYRKCCLKKAS